ncbi:ABC transporter permease [Blastopirellula retiformator]|nr:ABC transporter permease [Blastopirellula retiformator]
MARFLFVRIMQSVATVAVAVVLIFISIRLLPGNPALARFGQHAVPERVTDAMSSQGWDRPIWVQLLDLPGELLQGDLGVSFFHGDSVAERLLETIPATLELSLAAIVFAIPMGIGAGVASALWRGSWPDYVAMTLALVGVSVPVFFLGICLMTIFTNMPTSGRVAPTMISQFHTDFFLFEAIFTGRFHLAVDALRHLLLPATALATIPAAVISRITRSSMLEVFSSDYLRTAKAKGASLWRIVWRHALPNASVPIVNIAGFQVGMLLSGAVLTETVFNWPGLGRYLVTAVREQDYAVVQGAALVIAVMFVTANLILDLTYLWLDPRIRTET